MIRTLYYSWHKLSSIQRILLGILLGIVLGILAPGWSWISIFGQLFIQSLTALAPLLVFGLIIAAVAQHQPGQQTHMKTVIFLYLIATLVAAFVAVAASYLFPVELVLPDTAGVAETIEVPDSLGGIVSNLLLSMVGNPVAALMEGNYLTILFWAILIGLCLRMASPQTKRFLTDCSEAITRAVQILIGFAPLGIAGLVYNSMVEVGLAGMAQYIQVIGLVVGTMLFVGFIIYPLMTWFYIKENPYPLTMYCAKESGIPAFFTRSSAVNIPINLHAAEKLGLDKDSYTISITLGGTANSGGAAITVTCMTLAAAYTLGIDTPFFLAFLLSFMSAVAATGASGIAGGSLLLIPLAASLFNIPNEVAMQVVGVGFIIGVIQDSIETALNSASDLLFTAVAEFHDRKKAGEGLSVNAHVVQAKEME
ncbi:serine/threonine transporter SstT [Aerococcus urinaehominis]|uniref:Serine/threonine transporter SstT n=1 Tax=Aerococcus urinaehominis TaxID=128944 RepID=A0A109RGE0_9LACT|nr:serine/threonine transporter SstT [Aerococcus urinaehominis]AMB98649.1 serine/threonine transporter SstT [Aerococcus urinaehominis]SDL96931.1 serine/threonine transporter [Aerococcus urinaehominis]